MVDYFQVRRIVGFLQRTYPKPVTSHACLLYNICCVWKYHFYVSQEQVILNTRDIHCYLMWSKTVWKNGQVYMMNLLYMYLSEKKFLPVMYVEKIWILVFIFFSFLIFFLFLVHKKYYFYKSIFILGKLVIYMYNVL